MFKRSVKPEPLLLSGSAYGVNFSVQAPDAELVSDLRELVPSSWEDRESAEDALDLQFLSGSDGTFELIRDGRQIAAGDRATVLDTFERQVRMHIAFHAPDHVFVHAGAVSYRGLGVAIPGGSFSGKTSLTAALVRAGASYFSDECAILDDDGMMHGYAKPLAVRLSADSAEQTNHTAGDFGGEQVTEPVPLALVIATRYRPTGEWQPEPITPAVAALALFEHAFQGNNQPERALQRLTKAARGASGLRGERGDAAMVVADVIARLDELSSRPG